MAVHHKYIRLFLALVIILAGYMGMAQEICTNGIDDDNDGLIDLHDPDCQCHFTVTGNLLLNGSFETYNHCPVVYTYDSNYNAAAFWQYGTYTNVNEADYYHNLNCSFDSAMVMLHMPPRLPLPDGNGFISILNSTYLHAVPENQIAKSYVTQCLQAPLIPGENYTLSLYAGRFRSWDNLTGKIFPFTVAVFGNTNCNAVPFGKPYSFGNGCPTNYPGWVLLGETVVDSYGEWIQTKVNFNAPSPIQLIAVGPDSSILRSIMDLTDSTTYLDYHLYYLDDMHLLPTANFPFEYVQIKTGTGCNGTNVVLQAGTFTNASYQWYKDSIAIAGATNVSYQVPDDTVAGYYNVRITLPGKCITSEPFSLIPTHLNKLIIPADTVLCLGDSISLAPTIDGISYNVNGTPSSQVKINKAGQYLIIASDIYGCKRTFKTNVVEQKCSDCEPNVPNAFTPNGDGHNDVFKAKFFCPYSEFHLRIFDRWGEKLFEASNSSNGWDGRYLGNNMVPGVYIYFISYKTSSHMTRTKKGTITLIR